MTPAAFEKSGDLPLWRDLQLQLWSATGNNAAILQAVTPAKTLPANDILAFSEQVLYGEALMGQHSGPRRAIFGSSCCNQPKPRATAVYPGKLAATLVYSGNAAAIFAADS